jgi:hypothetical protein
MEINFTLKGVTLSLLQSRKGTKVSISKGELYLEVFLPKKTEATFRRLWGFIKQALLFKLLS